MSEYWKSTPKYWCKFCKTYVRDTSIEKKQHEATVKHQNNIQKSLRELHKNQSREDREKQRAKDELARVTGVVSGKPAPKAGPSQPISVAKSKPHFTRTEPVRASADDRKRQAEQLAAMGVAIPDEFRKDMAIASEWSTVSATPIYHRPQPKAEDEDQEDSKDDVFGSSSKRRRIDDEVEEEAPDRINSKRRVWGTTLKSYPGAKGGDANDFDALLLTANVKKEVEPAIKDEPEQLDDGVTLKKEESLEEGAAMKKLPGVGAVNLGSTQEAAAADAPVVFKKRKGKR
ncbi:hypothetical protein B9Z65_2469 [Elsinoe australis]|uniref:Matrin-type domain-containing protein n=1 Tax=Elsinoe australis TaxID=40998 RepID=A0A2P7ZAT4_9PEZI|nr:hypothetical protein B9Z65_2469 [Elsinoe australis]